jgi:hypothetical protein
MTALLLLYGVTKWLRRVRDRLGSNLFLIANLSDSIGSDYGPDIRRGQIAGLARLSCG